MLRAFVEAAQKCTDVRWHARPLKFLAGKGFGDRRRVLFRSRNLALSLKATVPLTIDGREVTACFTLSEGHSTAS